MFKSEKEKREAEVGARNLLMTSKAYSSTELENFKKMILTPCSYCSGSGVDPYATFSDCGTCKGFGVLSPDLDARRVLSTIALLTGEYSALKNESDQIKEVFKILHEELTEEE